MQLSIFDLLSIKDNIIDKLKCYEIDKIYKEKFKKDNTYTFLEIYKELSKNLKFKEYLTSLANELKKYIKESSNSHQDFYDNAQCNTFCKREDCIMIYNFKNKSIGPCYCAEMLSKDLFEEII